MSRVRLSKAAAQALGVVREACRESSRPREQKTPSKRGGSRKTTLVKDVLAWLKFKRVLAWRNNVGAAKLDGRFVRFGSKGMPDVVGILPAIEPMAFPAGRFLAIECKEGKGRPTRDQAAAIDAINRAGGLSFVARSIRDVEEALSREGYTL